MKHRNVIISGLAALACAALAVVVVRPNSKGDADTSRPLFHNKSPASQIQWSKCDPLVDRRGAWLWVDHELNLVLMVLTGSRERGRTNALFSDSTSFTVKTGPNDSWRYLTVFADRRLQDTAIVALPDGRSEMFALPIGGARSFYQQLQAKSAVDREDFAADFSSSSSISHEESNRLKLFLRNDR